MDFGLFDHLDLSSESSMADHYEDRLKLIELCDQLGFYALHVTEHHCTPLGGAASPSVFLSAAAQRTKRIRLGTMVYSLLTHHPIRLIEEICMIDQISRGRIDIGFGRGSVPMEIEYFGVEPANAQEMYEESVSAVLQGLRNGKIDQPGKYYNFEAVPIPLRPLQRPHPPLWYGAHSPESAERAARSGFNIVCNQPASDVRRFTAAFRKTWASERRDQPLPKIGLSRFVVVAPTDAEALGLANRAYEKFKETFRFLFKLHGTAPRISGREESFDEMISVGRGIAGSPDTVARMLGEQLAEADVNYCPMQMCFGDISLAEATRSVELFVHHVAPRLQVAREDAALAPTG